MDSEIIKKYQKAGEIWKKAAELSKKITKPGAKIVDIAEEVEALIKKEGGGLAFPLNIGINEVAAHFTPELGYQGTIKETDLVTLDIGVHVDGYIADAAITLSMDKDETRLNLIKAAETALKNAIDVVEPGVPVERIGETIENTMKDFNVKPISNLTGHNLEQYVLHGGFTIPNIKRAGGKIEEGTAIAIEPFSTNGRGEVYDAQEILIYEFLMKKPTRMQESRRILQMAEQDFNGLPFAKRWLERNINKLKLNLALRELVNSKSLYQYPVLKEKENGLVAQFEHTMVVTENGVIVTTR